MVPVWYGITNIKSIMDLAATTTPSGPAPFRILSLDGGGAKGFYTIGVLEEIEAMTRQPIHKSFDLIFGTSTGSIIAALLARGDTVPNVKSLYEEHVPVIMKSRNTGGRTRALHALAHEVFKNERHDVFKTGVGIVAKNWTADSPMISKHPSTKLMVPKDRSIPSSELGWPTR